jgi:two-component system phosphate regulon sensor histidine kinase PhoR
MDRITKSSVSSNALRNKDSHYLHAHLAEFLTILRETLVDLSGGVLCVGTMETGDSVIKLSARQPLSAPNLQSAKEKITARQSMANGATRMNLTVNGQPRSKYHCDPSAPEFQRQIVAPLFISNYRVGTLFVGSSDKSINQRKARLIRKLSRDLPRALRHLLYLNNRKKEKFEVLTSRALDGIILCDSSKRIQYINTAALQLLGLPLEERFVGQPLSALKASFLTEYLEQARTDCLSEVNKVVGVRRKHPVLIGAHLELIRNHQNSEIGWMFDLRDVTKNWQNDQLRSALTLASHEMKTPLSSIKGALELLLENDLGKMNDKQKHCLHIIKDDIVRLNRLLSDILDLSRFDEGIQFLDRRKEIALPILIHKVSESFKSFARSKNIKIVNRVSRNIPTFKGPRDRLQQVLANLLENSIKYTLPGGRVSMEAELKDNQLTFVVKDSGVGIPAEDLENIFQRFKQLDNYPDGGKQGFGLGLSISKEIIEAMGGKIWVESQVGVGSSFYFKIPV